MKTILTSFALFLALTLGSIAQSDTLIINLKSGATEKIALSQIQKISFENITAVDEQLQPSNLATTGNYPNPFGEQTNIEFEIAQTGNVEVMIFDNSGNQIKNLECNNCQVGKNSIQWNCTDKLNNRVQSGTYFYEVRFNNEVQSKKMIVIQ
jgi:hypothetical protein